MRAKSMAPTIYEWLNWKTPSTVAINEGKAVESPPPIKWRPSINAGTQLFTWRQIIQ